MLRAVTFDFWNTLFVDTRGRQREHRRAELLRDALATAGVTPDDAALERGLQSSWDYFDKVWVDEQRTPSCGELIDAILATLQATLPQDAHAELTRRFERLILDLPPEPTPGAVFTMPGLAERYRLAVICDTGYSPGAVLRELLERHELLALFEYTYFSNEHGMSKPDVRVFRHVLDELGVRAGEAAHVGDIQRTDVAGAQAAGMSAIHFIGANNHDAERSTGDVLLRHFDELPAALGGLICAGC